MKTKVLNFEKRIRITGFLILVSILSISSIAQNSCKTTIGKNSQIEPSEDLFALENLPEIEGVQNSSKAELNFVDVEEREEELDIESWMYSEFTNLEVGSISDNSSETEEELGIEEWMTEKFEIEEVAEPELEIESWMTDTWLK